MSKRFQNKTCAYCAVPNSSTTGDHIFAREFFDIRDRDNLPQVPSCARCNNDKSKLEHYLVTVIPIGSRIGHSNTSLWGKVKRRLDKNLKLFRALSEGVEIKWVWENGLFLPRMTVPFDGDKYQELFSYIVKGLMAYHWDFHLPDTHQVLVATVTTQAEYIFKNLHNLNAARRIEDNLGNGVFSYAGAQGTDNPGISSWKFTVLNGLATHGEGGSSISSVIYVLTGPQKAIDDLREAMG